MSTETYADVEEIQKDAEEATDKKLKIRVPIKQQSGSSVGSRRSSVGNVFPPIKQKVVVDREQKTEVGKQEKTKRGQVLFETLKEKIEKKGKAKRKKGGRIKSASSSRSRSRDKNRIRQKNANKEVKAKKIENDDSDDPDVSEIVLKKPEIKNISVEGVLPGIFLSFCFSDLIKVVFIFRYSP